MQLIEKTENVERVYEVTYDKEKLIALLDEIVKKASYKIEGTFNVPYGTRVSLSKQTIVEGGKLPNEDPMFINIKRIYEYTSDSSYSYHNDSTAIEGTKIVAPQLAYIIKGLLSDEPDSIDSFMKYESSEELIPIDKKIKDQDAKINETSNFAVDKKIELLEELKELCSKKDTNQYFDAKLLIAYYTAACNLIEMQLISEKVVKKGNKVLLKDYKRKTN